MIEEFGFVRSVREMAVKEGARFGLWEATERRTRSIYQLQFSDRSVFLHIKESNSVPGWWGLSPHLLMRTSNHPYLVILLNATKDIAYVATPPEVESRVDYIWRMARDGRYKIHENAELLGIGRLEYGDAVEFLIKLVKPSFGYDGDDANAYEALRFGALRADGIAEFMVRLPGNNKPVVRFARSNLRKVDLLAAFAAFLLSPGDNAASVIATLLPTIAGLLDTLSDDEALIVRILAETTASGPFAREEWLLRQANSVRKERRLGELDAAYLRSILERLERKGSVVRSMSVPPKWKLSMATL